jgi:ACS family D-galactonate transporter-like MFS transporter
MNRRWVVVALIFVGILISYVDRGNLSIAAPSIMQDFGLTPARMGLLLSAFFWTYALFQIPAGAIVDRFGIRSVYAFAFLLWSAAAASIALCRSGTEVVALRMVLGLGESAGPIASLSFIRRNFSGPEQGLPTSIYVAGQNVGPALGALLGTILLTRFGWRAMFAITGLGALVWLPWWLWLAPRDTRKSAGQAVAERASVGPLRPVLASRAFWAMSLCIFLSSYFWYFVLTWVPAYLTMSRGFSPLEMGRVLSTPLFVMAGANIVGGIAADRLVARTGSVFGVRLAFAAAGYAGSGAILLLLVLSGRAAVLPVLLVSICATGLGNSSYWSLAQHVPPAHLVGRTIGYLNTISQAAGAAAPLITGWILGPQKQFGLALAIAGVCPILAAACLLLAGANGLESVQRMLTPRPSVPVELEEGAG